MTIVERGVIYSAAGKPENERVACFADLCRTDSGVLFSTFQLGSAKNSSDTTLCIHRSRDEGRTWQRPAFPLATAMDGIPGSLSTGEMVEVQPGRLLLMATWIDRRDPSRPLFDPVTEGILPTKIIKAFSTDEGESWSAWEEVPFPGVDYRPHGSGPMVQWPDGTIALPIESQKPCEIKEAIDVQASWMIVSRDFGRSFEPPILVARCPDHRFYYWDQRVCAGKRPGEYLALFWTHDRTLGRDVNVHFKRGSLSGGGEILDTGIPAQISTPFVLPDGRLGALAVDRRFPGKIGLWRSADEGLSWQEEAPAYVHSGAARSAYGADSVKYAEVWEALEKWRFGHPAIRRLDGRRALITYYAGTELGLCIRWGRLTWFPPPGGK